LPVNAVRVVSLLQEQDLAVEEQELTRMEKRGG